MKSKLTQYIKLFSAIILSLLVTSFLMKEAFLANSPKFNPMFASNMVSRATGLASNSWSGLMALLPKNSNTNQPSQAVVASILQNTLKPVTSGVRASSYGSNSLVEYNLNQVEWVQITIQDPGGKARIIRVPKGTESLYQH